MVFKNILGTLFYLFVKAPTSVHLDFHLKDPVNGDGFFFSIKKYNYFCLIE